MINPITTVKIFSNLGNNSSLLPIAVKDMSHIAGMTTASYITGKEIEGKDRLIDEVGSTAMWIGGIPFYKKVIDLTLYKLTKYSPHIDVRILKDEKVLKKAIQHAPTPKIKESIIKAAGNVKMVKGLNLAKFIVSTALTLISYSALTTFRHKHTEKSIIKEIKKEETEKKLKEEYFKGKTYPAFKAIKSTPKNQNPSFGMNLSALQDFMFDPVKNMMIVDAGITASRFSESRNPQDFMSYVIKEGSFWTFIYFAGKKIQEHFENKSEQKYNKSIDLDIRALQAKELKEGFKKGTINASVKEFKKLQSPEAVIIAQNNIKESLFLMRVAGAIAAARSCGRGRRAARGLGRVFPITGWGGFLFIISFVKTGTFKDHTRTATNQTRQFFFMAFRAFRQFSICHGLQFFKGMPTGLAFVFIGWHIMIHSSF